MNKKQKELHQITTTSISDTNENNQQSQDDIFKVEKKILRIEYPGFVQNINKALETLGGINKIESVKN